MVNFGPGAWLTNLVSLAELKIRDEHFQYAQGNCVNWLLVDSEVLIKSERGGEPSFRANRGGKTAQNWRGEECRVDTFSSRGRGGGRGGGLSGPPSHWRVTL